MRIKYKSQSSPIVGLGLLALVLVLIFIGIVKASDWIYQPLEGIQSSTVLVQINTPTPLTFPDLTIEPTRQERGIAAMLAALHPQVSPEGTLEVYNRLLDALVQQRRDMNRRLERYVSGEVLETPDSLEVTEPEDCLPWETSNIRWRFDEYVGGYKPFLICVSEGEEEAPGSLWSPESSSGTGSYVD